MKEARIVFMGTPDFAVTILKGLLDHKHNVVGVITAPDRPAGRGRKLNESAVKKFAVDQNLKVLQPTNLKNELFLEELIIDGITDNTKLLYMILHNPEFVKGKFNTGFIEKYIDQLIDYR